MPELDGVLFDELMPANIKALVLEKLTETWALEIKTRHYSTEIENFIRKITLNDLQRNSVNPFEEEKQLWVDAYQVERTEDYPSSYLAIQLAMHWDLVDKVYLTPIHFSGCFTLWYGLRFDGEIVNKISKAELNKYFKLVSRNQFRFDPFSHQEYLDYTTRLERGTDN